MRSRGFLGMAIVMLASSATGASLSDNRKNLKKLEVGMTYDEVDSLMGGEVYSTENRSRGSTGSNLRRGKKQKVPNPYRTDVHQTDEHSFVVLLYYSKMKKRDGAITDDEMTPVVLKDGVVDGWGWDHWKGLMEEHQIDAPSPEAR